MGWLRRKLRAWLLDEPAELDFRLEALVPTKRGAVTDLFLIQGARGVKLLGIPADDSDGGVRLIGEEGVKDKEHFWRLWKHFNPDTPLQWEDGEPFEFEKNS